MSRLTKVFVVVALVFGLGVFGTATKAKAQCYGGYHGCYFGPTWHDTSYFDYHPGYFQQHGGHFHYVPGHYDFHRTGHYHP